MYEVWAQIVEHLSGMWRFRWRALMVAWFLALAGWAWVYALPNVYSASARVHVDTESSLRPLLRGLAVESNIQDQLAFMTRALLARPQLEKVARETDLDLRAHTPREMETIIEDLQTKIVLRRRRSSIYTISYKTRPRCAARRADAARYLRRDLARRQAQRLDVGTALSRRSDQGLRAAVERG
jgi:uncharacterized protein involved in exopolysaccharide biosynthesis